jgi:hypothetical protein
LVFNQLQPHKTFLSGIKKNVGSAQFGTFLTKNAHFGPANNANIMQILENQNFCQATANQRLTFLMMQKWQRLIIT